ncbi:hypothetical protein C8R43DRAFT_1118733 [Mycena crocata]|nr:hypothetical protein C8R43DRAFT_1118733 [Mycena crocata]
MYIKFTQYLILAAVSAVAVVAEPEPEPNHNFVVRANPTRTLAAPAVTTTSGCNPLDCRAQCGPGCGGTCAENPSGHVDCLCDC